MADVFEQLPIEEWAPTYLQVFQRETKSQYEAMTNDTTCEKSQHSKLSVFFYALSGIYLSDIHRDDPIKDGDLEIYTISFSQLCNTIKSSKLNEVFEEVVNGLKGLKGWNEQKHYLTHFKYPKALSEIWLLLNLQFSININRQIEDEHQMITKHQLPRSVSFYYYSTSKKFWIGIKGDTHLHQNKGFAAKTSFKDFILRNQDLRTMMLKHGSLDEEGDDFENAFKVLILTNKKKFLLSRFSTKRY